MSVHKDKTFIPAFDDSFPNILSALPSTISISSGLKDFSLETYQLPKGGTPELCFEHSAIGINTGQSVNCVFRSGEHTRHFPLLTGDVNIIPAGCTFHSSWDRQTSATVIILSPELLTRNAKALWGKKDAFTLKLSLAAHAPFITQLALAVVDELNASKVDKTYLTTMADALAVHLLKQFSTRACKKPQNAGTLSTQKLKLVIDYIDEHLEFSITIDELSKHASLSQHHFSRSFKKTTRLSPHQYIIQQRIEKAKQMISQQKISIDQIAITCGFSHQSHLNRHFKKLTGLTPRAFQNF